MPCQKNERSAALTLTCSYLAASYSMHTRMCLSSLHLSSILLIKGHPFPPHTGSVQDKSQHKDNGCHQYHVSVSLRPQSMVLLLSLSLSPTYPHLPPPPLSRTTFLCTHSYILSHTMSATFVVITEIKLPHKYLSTLWQIFPQFILHPLPRPSNTFHHVPFQIQLSPSCPHHCLSHFIDGKCMKKEFRLL